MKAKVECKKCNGEGWYFINGWLIDEPYFCEDCNPNNEKEVELPAFSSGEYGSKRSRVTYYE